MKRRGYLALAGSVAATSIAGCLDNDRMEWVFDAALTVAASPTVVEETVYTGVYNKFDGGGRFYAVDADSGDEKWQVSFTDDAPSVLRAPYVAGETVFVTTGAGADGAAGAVRALRTDSGEQQWARRFEDLVYTSPVVSGGTLLFSVGGRVVYALDSDTGETEWTFDTAESVAAADSESDSTPFDSSPTVVDTTAYVGSVNGGLHAIDVETGAEEWSLDVNAVVNSSPTVADETVYVGTDEGMMYGVDAESGDKQWRRSIGDSVVSSPTVMDQSLLCCDLLGTIHALDAETGESRWQFGTEGQIPSSPTVAGGRVFVGDGVLGSDSTGYVYALGLDDGQQEWKYDTGGRIMSSPTVVDGTVYVGNGGNPSGLCALDAGISGSSNCTRVSLRTLGYHDRA